MSFSSSLILGTCLITSLRGVLFLSCRKYVDASLYQELKQASHSPLSDDAVELDTLPPPSATPTSSGRPPSPSSTLHSVLARAWFSMCFSESCTLFFILMCQALNIFNPSTRLLNWRISLLVLLVIILVVVPMSLSIALTSGLTLRSAPLVRTLVPSVPRIIVTVAPLIVYFLLLSYIPIPKALDAPSETGSLLTASLSRLTVLGTVLLGALSGSGSVSTSWGYFPLSCGGKRKSPTQAEINRAELSLDRIRTDLSRKMEDIAGLKRREAEQAENAQSSWLSRVTPNFRGDSELSLLSKELSALSSLEDNMSSQVRWLRQQYAEAAFDRTLRGRIVVLGRMATGIYCVFRSISSAVNVLWPVTRTTPDAAPSYPDLLTSFLILLLSILPIDDSYTSPAASLRITSVLRQANLVVVGIIIWSSVRRVLRGVTRALRVTSRTLTASLMLLFLSQLMGIYLLSTLIQLRTSFPPPVEEDASDVSGEVTNLFTTLPEYQLFGPVFDWSFLLATGAAAGVEWVRSRDGDGLD
ncbi:hypothetical protein BV25DRAFT_491774 [Artomyces pyxidatus]|uniref:Uncharacterized protein n=1 Tax=Artomyces pyxidatus TaxID=48021 RepID=A0ACB8T2L6_9AGAM|nr:hypothetical protein BV25DRAFT_491774 [Artomyces pyxidatus]